MPRERKPKKPTPALISNQRAMRAKRASDFIHDLVAESTLSADEGTAVAVTLVWLKAIMRAER